MHNTIPQSPQRYYQSLLDQGLIRFDETQQHVVFLLDNLYTLLCDSKSKPKPKSKLTAKTHYLWQKIIKKKPQTQLIKGVYLWGSVGVGKTLLMDVFSATCPVPSVREHFHVFMQRVHTQLRQLQGTPNPLTQLAKQLASQVRVICFDEFFVHDIADAMLLGELFQALFKQGVILVATSNIAPEDLYKEGLQRERFLPAIKSILTHTTVYHLPSVHDYRMTYLTESGAYFFPMNAETDQAMEDVFSHVSQHEEAAYSPITILSREIFTRKHTATVAWFEFNNLCGAPRAQRDYIELAKQYHTILLSGVPVIRPNDVNSVTALIHLVDVLYDEGIFLVIQAEVPMTELYVTGKLAASFQRTLSRLQEMQSKAYLERKI